MIYKIYGIRDRLSDCKDISLYESDPIAIRAFQAGIEQAKGAIAFAPDDFELVRLGSFDTNTCMITCEEMPVLISRGVYK